MRASNWEFENRAMLFGMVFGLSFPLYVLDRTNSAAALADWAAPKMGFDPDLAARFLFVAAALLLALAAGLRTWASAYLHAGIVYAPGVKTESLVADGPYRYVRNPLYFANILMAIALGAMMSRLGLAVAVVAMLLFCYRLIFREEGELRAAQGQRYAAYANVVPRLWPAFAPRLPSAGGTPVWAEGFRAELWYWGFAAALAAFAATLSLPAFFAILTVSLAFFWVSTWLRNRSAR